MPARAVQPGALLAPAFGPLAAVLVVAVLEIVTELVGGRRYGPALLFITPMAMLMGQLAAPLPVGVAARRPRRAAPAR